MYNEKYNIEKYDREEEKFFNILYKISCIIKGLFGIM